MFRNWKTVLLQWQHSPNWSADSAQSVKNPTWLFGRNSRADSKIHMEMQETQSSQCNPEKKISIGGLLLPHFRARFKATVIKKVWDWQKEKWIDHEHNVESRNKPLHSWQIGFRQGCSHRPVDCSVHSTNGAGAPGQLDAKEGSWAPPSGHTQKTPRNGS